MDAAEAIRGIDGQIAYGDSFYNDQIIEMW
jgi:hypothetical protein